MTHAWAWLTLDEFPERESPTDDRVSRESDAVLALCIARKIASALDGLPGTWHQVT
jgi:hypothetical protein